MSEKFDFVVTLVRPQTNTTVRFIEQFNPFNEASGMPMNQQQFGEHLMPYVQEVAKEYQGWNMYVHLATNEEIAELSTNPLDNAQK